MGQDMPFTAMVIFGVTGDLSRRYLLPALSEICQNSDFRTQLKILGLSRQNINAKDVLTGEAASLTGQFEVFQMDYQQASEYQKLKQKLDRLKAQQVIFYFAVPPEAVLPIIGNLGRAELNGDNVKLLMEKPFGTDLASAQKIIDETNQSFKEEQIFRIDHYLAKEMAQNIAVFLGSNAIFRHVWSNEFIDFIEIIVAEQIGIEGRSSFYEQTGALRDIIQSHGLQLAALTLMEPCPHDFDFNELPHRRLSALKQLQISKDDFNTTMLRAQYRGYQKEVNNRSSTTETFAALKLVSNDPRWQHTPIFMATGKSLDKKLTQIRINFKQDNNSEPNMLILRVQPKEGIELDLWVKQPGYDRKLQKKTLSFTYHQNFEDRLPNAYEQIIVDAIRGSQSLFASSEEVLESWRILQPILNHWQKSKEGLKIYEPGSSVEEILQNT
ncbi:glucose-6-phosphate dehydrogenase (NADP(+)) [Candidatus Saccharibacteria bacterium]|nr:glucose-6-phosphate dehydrogenase (NADP(+)) [Candidatus Saccharibacteria bacterium]